jgi:hypothetical protein
MSSDEGEYFDYEDDGSDDPMHGSGESSPVPQPFFFASVRSHCSALA